MRSATFWQLKVCISWSKFINTSNKLFNPSIAWRKILSTTTNIKERLKACLRLNKALDGTASTLPEEDTCEQDNIDTIYMSISGIGQCKSLCTDSFKNKYLQYQ
jgi:hypothetical protein